MCLPFVLAGLVVSVIPLCAHEVAEEHAEHKAAKHPERSRKIASHSMESAEEQNEILYGRQGALPDMHYKDYQRSRRHRHHHRSSRASSIASSSGSSRLTAASRFSDHPLPSTVTVV